MGPPDSQQRGRTRELDTRRLTCCLREQSKTSQRDGVSWIRRHLCDEAEWSGPDRPALWTSELQEGRCSHPSCNRADPYGVGSRKEPPQISELPNARFGVWMQSLFGSGAVGGVAGADGLSFS